MNKPADNDALTQTELGFVVASTLHKLEHVSNFHVKERRKHFRITNIIVIGISLLLFFIALVNVFFLYDFYKSTMKIIGITHDLDNTVVQITSQMDDINHTLAKYNQHMGHMKGMYEDINSISTVMPSMSSNLSDIQYSVMGMNSVMKFVNKDIHLIDVNLQHMTHNVSLMGGNIYQIAKPISKFNKFNKFMP